MNEKLPLLRFDFAAYPYWYSPAAHISLVEYKSMPVWGDWFLRFPDHGAARIYLSPIQWNAAGNAIIADLQNNNRELIDFLLNHFKELITYKNMCQQLYIEERIVDLDEFWEAYKAVYIINGAYGYAMDYAFDQYVKAHNVQIPTMPFASFSHIELFELGKCFVCNGDLQMHIQKWGWIFNTYKGQADITNEMFVTRKEEAVQLFESHKSMSGIGVEDVYEPKIIADWIALITVIRDVRKEMNLITNGLLDRYLQSECEKYDIAYEHARMLTVEEFEAVKNNKKDIAVYQNREVHIINGAMNNIAVEQWNELETEYANAQEQGNIIKGITACKGNVTGTAKVILSENDFGIFEKGDIIVTSMTRPEFMPIVKDCKAIVANEGGITCHAAIISRELNIPCVIAVKGATTRIKTGDRICVNADEGFVEILGE